MTNEQVTTLQLAIESQELHTVSKLIENEDVESLGELQIFADHTLLMYACERGSPEIVSLLLDKGVGFFELEWSVNNELKSALRNEAHRLEILTMLIEHLPEEAGRDLISTDWDPDPDSEEKAQSPIEMARDLASKDCEAILQEKLKTYGDL